MVNFSYFCTFFKPKSINRFGSMKTFTFRPKLFSSLKGYSKETFYRRPNGRHHRRHRRAAAGYRIRHRVGRLSRKRDYHGHHRRVRHLAAGRQQSTDRRPHRSLYRDRLRYHRPLRRNRTDRSDDHGRRDPGHARRLQAGHGHQIHPPTRSSSDSPAASRLRSSPRRSKTCSD